MDEEEDPDSGRGFECERCGFCCQLDVLLSKEDISMLKKAGMKGFAEKRPNGMFLKKKGIWCVFLDQGTRSCKAYEFRPGVCRRFPFGEGTFSQKCRQNINFGSRVTQSIIKFISMDDAKK